MTISEELLHFIWRFRLYDPFKLKSHSGEDIEVIDPGTLNQDAGPDFLFAKIKMGPTIWVGHVEIHTAAKYWRIHGHQHDPTYDNVILHVIWDGYCEILRKDQTSIPTLSLHPHVDLRLLQHYEELMKSTTWIPCVHRLSDIPSLLGVQLMSRMLIDRLESKYRYVLSLLDDTKNDWEKVTSILLFRAFGMRVNKEAFTDLGIRFPVNLVEKYRNDGLKIEALLFGQAGMLSGEYQDDYPIALKGEYGYLSKLHELQAMDVTSWKFMRMRPVNFPTVRIGQLASLFRDFPRIFSFLLEVDDLNIVKDRLLHAVPNTYWNDHYHFNKSCSFRKNSLSESFVHHLIINAGVLILYAYGKYMQQPLWIDKAMDWLEIIPAEHNQITRHFQDFGLSPKHAGDTQALLHLKAGYCDNKKCLDCQVGHFILKS